MWGVQGFCYRVAEGGRGGFWQEPPGSITQAWAGAVPPAVTASSLPRSRGLLTSSSVHRGCTSRAPWLHPPAPLPENTPSVPHVSSCHANYNRRIIPEQPPRRAVLFIGKQPGWHGPDKLLRGINKTQD